jgi:hypothetical protein
MPPWHRLAIVAVVLFLTAILARLVDRGLQRRSLPPEVARGTASFAAASSR